MLKKYRSDNNFIDILNLEKQHYYTKAANKGLKSSNAEICTLLNSDTVVTSRWAEKIQAAFRESASVGIVGPLSNAASTQSVPFVKSSKDQTAINSLPPNVGIEEMGRFIEKVGQERIRPFVPLVHGFCLSIHRNVFDKIGYFDEAAFPRGYGEENDFCLKAEDAGFFLSIAIDTFVFHSKSKSYASEERVQFMRDGMKNLVARHGERRVRDAVHFMEQNPHLDYVREKVRANWPSHYSS